MRGREQRHTPSEDVTLLIKLGVRQMCQAALQFVRAEVERDLQVGFRDRFAARDLLDNRATQVFLLTVQQHGQPFGNRFKWWMLHRFPSCLFVACDV